jgi:hypothetical protein
MSQNPNNPYEQNPPDPNATPGTYYGSKPPPPGQGQGSAPNYGPYTPGATPPGQNPNYGSYNPYTPSPPTPGPAVNPNYNPYDPYAPTLAGQGAQPDYNPYEPPAPPALPPTQPRSRGISGRVILLVVLALVLVVGGVAFGLVSYNTSQTNNAHATATAQTGTQTAHAQLTATAQINVTATAIASTYPFSANLKLSDPLTDNSKGYQWDNNDNCKFEGNAYHDIDSQTNTFSPCLAVKTDFSDFTFEVEMSISKGEAGGLIFRGNEAKTQYYRAAIFSDGTYGIYIYVDNTATNARMLKSGNIGQTLNATNTIGVVARGSTITLYVNQTEVTSVTDSTYTHGQIGFSADDSTASADVVYTNAKVWLLPPGA